MDNKTPLVKGGQGRSVDELVRAMQSLMAIAVAVLPFCWGPWSGAAGVAVAVVWFCLGWAEHDGQDYRRGVAAERERTLTLLEQMREDN